MIYMAEIDNGCVAQVIVLEELYENEASFIKYCQNNFGGDWVQTWKDSEEKPYPRGKMASPGDAWDRESFLTPAEKLAEFITVAEPMTPDFEATVGP